MNKQCYQQEKLNQTLKSVETSLHLNTFAPTYKPYARIQKILELLHHHVLHFPGPTNEINVHIIHTCIYNTIVYK